MKKKAQEYYQEKINNFYDKKDRILSQDNIDIKEIKNIHITGSCGKAMASISGLFSDGGFNVSGSDSECKPPMSIILDNLNLKYNNYNPKNIKNKDLIVVGNVCTPNNIEVLAAKKNNTPQVSGAESVEKFFIGDKKSLVVAGTHGKTSTSSLLSHIFLTAKKPTGFLVGGVLENYNTSYKYEKNDSGYFIIEGDEYDTAYFDKAPKFLHYKPYKTIITSVEFDHADIYKNLTDYRQAFKFLSQETKSEIII
ncbi:MAG TPA: hypothetical protein EYG72_01940 [Candidatus Pacebacteria bacterium]|nr:hypothetical protein [Candidatus Paceibacterota bacterium]